MDRAMELDLLEELAGLKAAGSAFLDPDIAASPVSRYASSERFESEQRSVFRANPIIAAHSSELAGEGAFLTRELAGVPILLSRDKEGRAHAFLNVCRHRGARLVGEASGCKKLFTCPYHAWSYTHEGKLRSVPHEEQGFPEMDREAFGLRRLPVAERYGWIWVVPNPRADADFDALLDPLDPELKWLGLENHAIALSDTIQCKANWKLLIEGGIEAYHFKVAHKHTIGPHFQDNLSSYSMFGQHMRSVLPRASLDEMAVLPKDEWSIRSHANVLYTIFPSNQWLVMQDHVAWVQFNPRSEGETELRLTTLAPADQITPDMEEHWRTNHGITMTTLGEDFAIGEAIQAGFASGANEALTFGRYEGALDRFNREVEAVLE